MNFVTEIYQISKRFPAQELYGLTSQLRRAATSVALNIAEGSGAGSDAEFNRFLNIALRSNYELMCAIEIANRLKYCSDVEAGSLISDSDEIAAMISGLKQKLKAED